MSNVSTVSSDSSSTALINIAPKLVWSLIALLFLVMFHSEISHAIDNASDRGGATVEVGTLKISLPKRDIPTPPKGVKEVLPNLDAAMIDHIVANVGGENTPEICYETNTEFTDGSVSSNLIKQHLITIEKESLSDAATGKPCLVGGKTRFTSLYNQVRQYLLDVLKALQFSK